MRKINLWIKLSLIVTISAVSLQSNAQEKITRTGSKEKLPSNLTIQKPNDLQSHIGETSTKSFTPKTISSSLLNKGIPTNYQLSHVDKNGIPRAIIGSPKRLTAASRSIDEAIYLHLEDVKNIMRIVNTREEFIISSKLTDEQGRDHITLDQQYNGVPVYGGQVKLHGKSNQFNFLNGKWHTTPYEISNTEPALSIIEVEQKVKSEIGDIVKVTDQLKIFNHQPIESKLVIYYDENNKPNLAYHSTVYKTLLDRWEYFTDANSGAVIHSYESICKFHNHDLAGIEAKPIKHSKIEKNENSMFVGHIETSGVDLLGQTRTLNTYEDGSNVYMIDINRDMFVTSSMMPNDPAGSIWTIDAFNSSPQKDDFSYDHVTSSSTQWDNPIAVSAHYNGSRAYDYFRQLHVRNSINGSGGNIISLINVADEDGKSMENAFWNGQAMFYGNGGTAFKPLARGLDVAGHEMTHGVVQSTANLEYQGESGALNESFADVFGTMIDRDDWVIGEDVVNAQAFPSGALRSLIDPHNGAATGDFGSGWQPKHYSERYTGSQDNGGVHINSGIPNHAFYLFASNAGVGIEKAEKVYYKALSEYLTRSSQFIDAKIAVERAALDLYGADVAAIATQAFEDVGVLGSTGGNYEEEVEQNEGRDLVLWTEIDDSDNNNNIYIADKELLQYVFNPLTESDPISKPSVTDNGRVVVFVSTDGKIHYIDVDYNTRQSQEQVLNTSTSWRNAIISKDGRRIAALSDDFNNQLVVFNLETGDGVAYDLFIPTTAADNTTTGDVEFADAMEFDITGEFVMYDALNKIQSQSSGDIHYWDISFIQVWDNKADDFTDGNRIEKLFANLPEGITIGNPAFSKNSPHIIAFDYFDEEDFAILGTNLETGDVQLIAENVNYGYPNYSKNDDEVIFDVESFLSDAISINVVSVNGTKIQGEGETALLFEGNNRWGVRFSDGTRVLTSTEIEQYSDQVILSPNPGHDVVKISFEAVSSDEIRTQIYSINGQLIKKKNHKVQSGYNEIDLNINDLIEGAYFVKMMIDNKLVLKKFTKM